MKVLFGSAVYSDKPSDIDIAIIYDRTKISVQEAIQYRHQLQQELSEVYDLSIDTLLLSEEEEREMSFLANAKHILLG